MVVGGRLHTPREEGWDVGTLESGSVNEVDGTIVEQQDVNARVGDVFIGMASVVCNSQCSRCR
jgi:hypothetical protein